MILPLYAGLDRIPQSMLEAARDLGAGRTETFRRVIWPMSRTAVVVSLLVTTLPMLGDYFTNDLLSGSPDTSMVGNLINNSVLTPGQTGQAGAFVLLILVVSIVPMALYVRSTRTGSDVQT
jgi:spermidine/putrescine transport system permease protein